MGRSRAFDEDKVLRAVRDQFWDGGYGATTLEDLMRVSGLGKGSLYAAFGDKRQLFLRALQSYTDDLHRALQDGLASSPRAVDGLRKLLAAPADSTTGAVDRRGCLMANSTYELGSADEDVLDHARRTYTATAEIIRESVIRAQREGDLPPEADSEALARAVLTAQQGMTFMSRAGWDLAALTAAGHALEAQLLSNASVR